MAKLVLKQLENFQAEQLDLMERQDRSLEQLAAYINNNLNCYEQITELAEKLGVWLQKGTGRAWPVSSVELTLF